MAETIYTPPYQSIPNNLAAPVVSWQDLVLKYGTLLTRYQPATGTSTSTTIYTVPAGKVLFLLTAQLTTFNFDTAGDDFARIMILPVTNSLSTNYVILEIKVGQAIASVSKGDL